jgi:hypothetical protein
MVVQKWNKNSPELIETVNVFREQGRNVSATARAMGVHRRTIGHRLDKAVELGILGEEETGNPNAPNAEQYESARERKIKSFQKKQKTGSWDKPVLARVAHRQFRIKLFGDPHMDSDAFDIDLFEKHWFELDAAGGVYGVMIGDMFNNWLRVLSHLWKHEGDPDDAWTLFEHYMEQRGSALIAACSGNHDDWTHAPADPIDLLMKRHGVVYRQGAVRVVITDGEKSASMALRHKWRGHSMYSPAHGLRRAAQEGWHDNIMVGGHTHQDEDRATVQPRTGFISNLFQLSAFKRFDEFADVHGFKPHATLPIRDLVVDLDRADNDPDKVKTFYDGDGAAAYLAWARGRAG